MKTEFWLFGAGPSQLELWMISNGQLARVDNIWNFAGISKGCLAAKTLAGCVVQISRKIRGPITVYLYPSDIITEMNPGYYRRLTPYEESQVREVLQAENQRQYARYWT